jgi:Mrp family chromosome partitioning ATPase
MIEADATSPVDNGHPNLNGPSSEPESSSKDLVRLVKPIVVNSDGSRHVDTRVVAFQYYNCFNYTLLAKDHAGINLAVGITSPNPGEGKTLVASNLAVSLAIANQRETVLVDLNIRNSRLHSIFGTKPSPGLIEALSDGAIHVSETKIKHLYVLAAGNVRGNPWSAERLAPVAGASKGSVSRPSVGLEHLAAFRDVIYSLKQEFEFVIVDMPSIHERRFPILFTNQLDGLVVVIDARKTKHGDVDAMFHRLNKSQVMGFVFNRVDERIAQ